MARDVGYVLEIVDDIPDREHEKSPLEPTLEKIAADYTDKPITAIIALYGKPSACTASANVLRQRHGSQDVEGWRFETRHVDRKDPETGEDVTKTALYVSYDPTKVVPGAREVWDRKMAERKGKLDAKRAAKKAAAGGNIQGNTVGTGSGAGITTASPANTTAGVTAPQPAQGTTSTAPGNADKVVGGNAQPSAPSAGNPPTPAAAQPTAPGKSTATGATEPAGTAPKK